MAGRSGKVGAAWKLRERSQFGGMGVVWRLASGFVMGSIVGSFWGDFVPKKERYRFV